MAMSLMMQEYANRLLESDIGDEVREKLIKGWSVSSVCAFVEERGVLAECSRSTLCRLVAGIRRTLSAYEQADGAAPITVRRAVDSLGGGLDVLVELKDLYMMQRERIEIDFRVECGADQLLPTTHREVRTAMDLLNSYAKVLMDYGLVRRDLGKVTVEGHTGVEENVLPGASDKVHEALADPQRRQKLLGVLRKLSAAVNPDGGMAVIDIDTEDEDAD